MLSLMSHRMECPLGQLASAVLSLSLPRLGTLSLLPAGAVQDTEPRAGLGSVDAAQLQQKQQNDPPVTSAVSSTNPQLHSCDTKELPQLEPVHS